jgi:hypothetical protein
MVVNDGIIRREVGDIAQVGKLDRDRPLRSRMQIEDPAGAGCGSIGFPRFEPAHGVQGREKNGVRIERREIARQRRSKGATSR